MTNREFEERTGLPSNASRKTLENLGGRYFSTEPFELKGEITKYEQVQFGNSEGLYMWKRLNEVGKEGNFEIHLESTPNNTRIHKTSYCNKT
jgi:hypothetical protein|tara:strand:- start:976 stop:1251 length:276 start_codon:yes stop_codon:yes gene_type:complete